MVSIGMLNVIAPSESAPAADWSLELLRSLDWHRFQELACRLLHRSGFLPEVSWIRPDGASGLYLLRPERPGYLEGIVHCSAWADQEIDAGAIKALHQALKDTGAPRGIFATPGTYREEARSFVGLKPLELVDGPDLLRTIDLFPPQERSVFLRMTTAGACTTPTCPACLKPMELIDDSAALSQREEDMVYKNKRSEGSEIDCRSLTLRKGAEIVFMKNVTAGGMTVHGKATGNIVVNGRLHVAAGGCVSGIVSARAIQLDPGGTMEAEARILNEADLTHLRPVPVVQSWRCSAHPACRGTLPVR